METNFAQDSNLWDLPIPINVSIGESASISRNSQLKIIFSTPQAIDWNHVQENGGSTYGIWSYDPSEGTAAFTFNVDIASGDHALINFILNLHPAHTDGLSSTISASLNDQPLTIAGGTRFKLQKPAGGGGGTYNGFRFVPGRGSYATSEGIEDNYIGPINGSYAYLPDRQSMDFNVVMDPGFYSNTSLENLRTITISVSGTNAALAADNILISNKGGWPISYTRYVPLSELGWSAQQITPQKVRVNIPDGFVMGWYILGVVPTTPDVQSRYTISFDYSSNLIGSQVQYLDGVFQVLGNVGFIPRISAGADRTLKQGTPISDMSQWLLQGVTASDVEDGNLTGKVTVDVDDLRKLNGKWDRHENGTTEIGFNVTDSDGNQSKAKYKVTVYSDVHVHYKDVEGNTIRKDAILAGNVGETFDVDRTDFKNDGKTYLYVSSDPDMATGTFGQDNQPTEITLTYRQDYTGISASDYTMHVGDPAPTADDFHARATDRDNNPLPVTVHLDQADLNTPGTYPVTITATDTQTTTATLTVLPDQRSISASDYTMHVGDPAPTADDFHARATDRDNNPLPVTVHLDQADLNTPGTYPVTITATDTQTTTATLTVLPDQRSISASDYTMHVGDPAPTADDFHARATDRDNNP
ncbi:MucBP domain-containing protein, partial [Bifidobacterium favimelis]|uniref:MucBP domain-containing protein n=1 Tax=Bifidobacterium favimelis TaxID=3122979 RepID=UPI0030EC7035